MDKDTTPAEPRLDEDLTVEDESAEQVTGGHSRVRARTRRVFKAGHQGCLHQPLITVPSAESAEGDFLRRLTDAEAKSLETRSRRKSFARGAIIFRDGDPGGEALVLRAGRVKVSARRHSREVILAVLDPGSLLGEVSAIDGGPRSATVVALEPVEVDAVSVAHFHGSSMSTPAWPASFCSWSSPGSGPSPRQVEFGTIDMLGRLCGSLTQLAERYGRPLGDHVEVDAPINQQELAEWAGMSRRLSEGSAAAQEPRVARGRRPGTDLLISGHQAPRRSALTAFDPETALVSWLVR